MSPSPKATPASANHFIPPEIPRQPKYKQRRIQKRTGTSSCALRA